MFKMGRSPRSDSNENQPYGQPQHFDPHAAQAAHTQTRVDSERPPAPASERAPSTPRAVTESEALARDLREGLVSGFIGGGTVVSGEAEFKGMLRIDGHFTGRILSEKGSLIVSAGGKVEANVQVAEAKINGTVNGDIVAGQRIELGRSARVHGNIQTPALVIEEGAVFEGSCRMVQTKAEAVKAAKADAPRASAAPAQPKPAAKSPQPQAVANQPAHQPTPQSGAVTANVPSQAG